MLRLFLSIILFGTPAIKSFRPTATTPALHQHSTPTLRSPIFCPSIRLSMSSADPTPSKRPLPNNEASATASPEAAASAAVDFLTLTRTLKTTKRTGWVMRGVRDPESIADHMYRMSLMSMMASFSDESLDTNKCIQMALVHDLAEATVGDITPHCGVSDKDKHTMESEAMERITGALGASMGGERMRSLWKEYEEGTTPEARLLKDLDKLEMIMQAQEYEAEGSAEKSLDQFFSSTEGIWKTEVGKAWAREIVSRRKSPPK